MADEPSAPTGTEMTQRERRRQQSRGSGGGGRQIRWGKVIVPLLLLTVAGAVVAVPFVYNDFLIDDSCPGHWHSTMKAYVNGTEVDFTAYNLESQRTPISSHFHRNDARYKWHFEPAQRRCIEFREAASYIDLELHGDRIVLDGLHENAPWGGEHRTDGNNTVQALHKVGDNDWRNIEIGRLNERQLRDGERVLILYGDYTEDQVRSYQESVPDPYATGPTSPR